VVTKLVLQEATTGLAESRGLRG